MYKFSILKLAADGVEGFTGSQAWPVVSAKQEPHCSLHPRSVWPCWPCWCVPNDSSPSPARHKRTVLLQLEVLRLKTMLVCVTKQGQPHSYRFPQCDIVQLWVLRNGALNFSPSQFCKQIGPSCAQWNSWGTYTCWKTGHCSYFLLIREFLMKVFLSIMKKEEKASLMPPLDQSGGSVTYLMH